ncbi:MAG: TolC family outer membrane protein, partial [Legionellales bacterium]|nr:TolC family outer membrane protein [Legionellales bacterium]
MRMKFWIFVRTASLAILGGWAPQIVWASPDLVDVFNDAVLNDATFQAAYYTRMSVRETLPQAESLLLPQAVAVADVRRLRQINSESAFAAEPGFRREEFFNPQVYTIDLNQTIFNYQSWMQVQAAKSTVKQAEATFNSEAQSLIFRTASAYFDVLAARDNVRFTRAELRATQRRLEQALERYKVGLDAVTSVYEAQAEYDGINAFLIEAENTLGNRLEDLRILTGREYKSVAPLKGEVPLLRPMPEDVEQWVDTAAEQNYQVQALKFANDAARDNIKAERAGNFPVLTGNLNHFDNRGANVGGAGFDNRGNSAGIIANFPVIQGGLIASRTRQARYDYDFALAQYEQRYREVVVGTRQTYNTVISGISKVKADKQAIISALNSVDSIEAQYRVGTRTLLDVLDSQRNLFEQQRIFAADQYTYILSTLELKFLAGTLSVEDVQLVNELLPHLEAVPERLRGRKVGAMIAEKLAFDEDSPLNGVVKSETVKDGVIQINSLIQAIEQLLRDPTCYVGSKINTVDMVGTFEEVVETYKAYWAGVKSVFKDAWGLKPKDSRLMHGAG